MVGRSESCHSESADFGNIRLMGCVGIYFVGVASESFYLCVKTYFGVVVFESNHPYVGTHIESLACHCNGRPCGMSDDIIGILLDGRKLPSDRIANTLDR